VRNIKKKKKCRKYYTPVTKKIIHMINTLRNKHSYSKSYVARVMGYHPPGGCAIITRICGGDQLTIKIHSLEKLEAEFNKMSKNKKKGE
jgi:hypothetical protein